MYFQTWDPVRFLNSIWSVSSDNVRLAERDSIMSCNIYMMIHNFFYGTFAAVRAVLSDSDTEETWMKYKRTVRQEKHTFDIDMDSDRDVIFKETMRVQLAEAQMEKSWI